MQTIFSFPAFFPSDSYSVVGYNVVKSNAHGNTYLTAPISSTGSQTIGVADVTNLSTGMTVQVDSGSGYEAVQLTGVGSNTVTGDFTKTHATNCPLVGPALSPNPFGPWNSFLSNTTQNLDIVDNAGCNYDYYRVQPIVAVTAGPDVNISIPFSKAFFPTTPLYDSQISLLIDSFRQNYLRDVGIASTDSTIPVEGTGQGALPFIVNPNTIRFYLAQIPNNDPQIFDELSTIVFSGQSPTNCSALVPYQDFYANGDQGYIDFASPPSTNSYLKVEYTSYLFSNSEIKNALLNSVSEVALFGITDQDYNVDSSWNLYYLTTPLPSRDLGRIVCSIAFKNFIKTQAFKMALGAESWKIGTVTYTSDPTRSIQGAIQQAADQEEEIKRQVRNYIYNYRTYFSRGEFDSFFDNSGILYPPFSVYNVFNYMSWWI